MPNPTFDSICRRARGHLNDSDGERYTNAKLHTYVEDAIDELVDELLVNGVPALDDTSATITVPASTTLISYITTPALPADLEEPIALNEKAVGAPDSTYVPMTKVMFLPPVQPVSNLGSWLWEEQTLKLIGATSNRDVLIYYQKGVPLITGEAEQEIPLLRSLPFISYKAAALAAALVDNNENRALVLHEEAQVHLASLVAWHVRSMQGTPVRRRSWRRPSRRRFVRPRTL